MLVYEGIKSGFINDVDLGIILIRLEINILKRLREGQVHQSLIHGRILCNI